MRKWLAGAICAALFISAPNKAIAFTDGNQLWELAISEDMGFQLAYLAYIRGVVNGFSLSLQLNDLEREYCLDRETIIGDLGSLVRIWLRKNHQVLDMDAEILVVAAITDYFPCKKEGS